jgi:hypothetical protein
MIHQIDLASSAILVVAGFLLEFYIMYVLYQYWSRYSKYSVRTPAIRYILCLAVAQFIQLLHAVTLTLMFVLAHGFSGYGAARSVMRWTLLPIYFILTFYGVRGLYRQLKEKGKPSMEYQKL